MKEQEQLWYDERNTLEKSAPKPTQNKKLIKYQSIVLDHQESTKGRKISIKFNLMDYIDDCIYVDDEGK